MLGSERRAGVFLFIFKFSFIIMTWRQAINRINSTDRCGHVLLRKDLEMVWCGKFFKSSTLHF